MQYTICVSFAAGSIASGNKTMMRDLNCSHELAVMALAGFPLGFSFGPLALAPFSEVYGRFYVYVCSSVLFVIFLVPIARAENISTVIVFRIFLGVVGSTGSTLVGGTISDMFGDKDRGLAMGIFSVASISGTGLGPMTMGFVADAWGWRGIAYVQMTFAGVLAVLICCFTRETRGSVLLSRRAAKLRKDTGSDRYQVRSDAERASLAIMVKTSLTRPLCKPINAPWLSPCMPALTPPLPPQTSSLPSPRSRLCPFTSASPGASSISASRPCRSSWATCTASPRASRARRLRRL